jgi:glycerophosphoryl diester phosphodiesterase
MSAQDATVTGSESASVAAPVRVRLYAHRGASAEAPENTLVAFARALEAGADALELDLRMTRDGAIVVAHDATTKRTTGVKAEIRRTTLEELQALDAGYEFRAPDGARPFRGRGIRVTTLEEVLCTFPHVLVNADLKQWRPGAVAPVLRLIRRLGAEERVLLTSLRGEVVRAVRRLGYGGPTGMPVSEAMRLLFAPRRALAALPVEAAAAQVPARLGPLRIADARLVKRCRALGLRLDVFTVNDAAEARRLVALGVDGIMTDDPARIGPVVREACAAAPANAAP